MRISAVLILIFSLAACNRGLQSNDAVRQGVLDHLAQAQAKTGLNLNSMDVNVTSVQFKGSEADAAVSIVPKGGNPAAGMSINYHLQQQGNKWIVVGRQDGGASPHGAVAAPDGGSNPHGGAMPPDAAADPHGAGGAPGATKMPSPDDLPPTGKKK